MSCCNAANAERASVSVCGRGFGALLYLHQAKTQTGMIPLQCNTKVSTMASTTTNIPRASLASRFQLSDNMKRVIHRFVLARELSALRQAQHHVSKPEIFDKRLTEISAELAALRKA
jgi:hypothetical protein